MRIEIIKCDRCGKELNDEVYNINLPYSGADLYGYTTLRERKIVARYEFKCLDLIPRELCRECLIGLIDLMNEVE